MKTINVYQCELDKTIPLEYVGLVKYIGESFGVDSLTNGNDYYIVKDQYDTLKVVDDSDEDYIYCLTNPAPGTGYSEGGIFHYIDDPSGILANYMEKYNE